MYLFRRPSENHNLICKGSAKRTSYKKTQFGPTIVGLLRYKNMCLAGILVPYEELL